MENNNDKSKTEKFTPMNKSPKPEINRNENDAYSEARRTPQYDFRDDEEDNGSNNRLIVISVILAVLLVIAIVVSILLIGATKKENPEEENSSVNIEETLEEEEEEPEEKTGNYNIVFYGETIIEKDDYIVIDADLFDNEMTRLKSRKIKITPETRIISGGKSITKTALLYLIEGVVDEKIVFEGTVREEDGLALKLTFEYNAEEMPETNEEIPEEPGEEEPPVEEPADEPVLDVPVENQGTPIE